MATKIDRFPLEGHYWTKKFKILLFDVTIETRSNKIGSLLRFKRCDIRTIRF